MIDKWRIRSPEAETVQRICRKTGCHPVIATILANRGITAETDAVAFLNPSLKHLRLTDAFADMDKAVQRISAAILSREKILIFGDYDVDGVTATVTLLEFLKHAGANASYYIPHRIEEGYGLKPVHIISHAVPSGITLIITVDCGSSSHEAVDCARKSGIDVIVTDHHEVPNPPQAFAVINPRRHDCPSGFGFLSGVGVVFYLLLRLRKHLRDIGFWTRIQEPNLMAFCDLVALGTVSDIVPLIKENRIITRTGLGVINSGARPGIRALVECCASGKPAIDAEDIAFRLGPRINAAGRMSHARLAVELLLSQNMDLARKQAEGINALNSQRQGVENRILSGILMYLQEEPRLLENKTLVLGNAHWHAGVLGIVASKLAKTFSRPVVLVSFQDPVGKGSARSIPGINLYEALIACSNHLEGFGGHPMAAGLRVRHENFTSFQQAFEKQVRSALPPEGLAPDLEIDCELGFDMISDALMDQIENLQPFGAQNPEPLFLSKNIRVAFSNTVKEKHIRFVLKQGRPDNETKIVAIWFNAENDMALRKYFKRIAYRIRRDRFNGGKSIQLIVEKAEV